MNNTGAQLRRYVTLVTFGYIGYTYRRFIAIRLYLVYTIQIARKVISTQITVGDVTLCNSSTYYY